MLTRDPNDQRTLEKLIGALAALGEQERFKKATRSSVAALLSRARSRR
ncbi:MAG TPA: hypothetical protein VGQ83_20500 [Polyangia bacterium]|jgi:hypothetical protein